MHASFPETVEYQSCLIGKLTYWTICPIVYIILKNTCSYFLKIKDILSFRGYIKSILISKKKYNTG